MTLQLATRREAPVGGIIFNKSGTGRAPPVERIAQYLDTEFLGHVPDDSAVPTAQDRGRPVVVENPDSPAAQSYRQIAAALLAANGEDFEESTSREETFSGTLPF